MTGVDRDFINAYLESLAMILELLNDATAAAIVRRFKIQNPKH